MRRKANPRTDPKLLVGVLLVVTFMALVTTFFALWLGLGRIY